MPIPPRVVPSTITTPPANSDDFRPIPLRAVPILGSDGACGVRFMTEAEEMANFDLRNVRPRDCGCDYSIANTRHCSIAGVTGDGTVLYGVNCWVNGRCSTILGAFDPAGNPTAPTRNQRLQILARLPSQDNPIEFRRNGDTGLGARTKSNPSIGAYIDPKKKTATFEVTGTIGSNPSLRLNGSGTFNSQGQLTSTSASANGALGRLSANVNATRSSSGSITGNGGVRFAAGRARNIILTASYFPDVRAPSTPSLPKPFEKPVFQDYSRVRVGIEIKF